MNRISRLTTALAAAALLHAGGAVAADYPAQPITLVVPYAPGGGADNAARIIAKGLAAQIGRTVVIENKSGASGSIGAAFVARAAADGYTVLYDSSALTINPALRKLPYDTRKDLVPVSQAVSVPNIMVVAQNAPFASLQDYVAAAKAAPGKYTYASYGPGSLAHMAGELLKQHYGLDIVHVPYKGGAPALVDVMGGQVHTYFANAASSLGYVSGGKLKALAVTSATRMPELPDVPTVAEGGVKDFAVLEWNGFFLPAGTPAPVVETLSAAIRKTLAQAEIRQQLGKLGLTVVGSTPAEFSRFVDAELRRWSDLVQANRITVN